MKVKLLSMLILGAVIFNCVEPDISISVDTEVHILKDSTIARWRVLPDSNWGDWVTIAKINSNGTLDKLDTLSARLSSIQDFIHDYTLVEVETLDCAVHQDSLQALSARVSCLEDKQKDILAHINSQAPDPPVYPKVFGGFATVKIDWGAYDSFTLYISNEFTHPIDSMQFNIWSSGVFDYMNEPTLSVTTKPELGGNADDVSSDYVRVVFNDLMWPNTSMRYENGDVDGDASDIIIDIWISDTLLTERIDSTGFVRFTIVDDSVSTSSAIVSWNANKESDLIGYKIYYGFESRNYTNVIDVGNVVSYTIDNLPIRQTAYFAVSAYDTYLNESGLSQEVCLYVLGD